jgi:hypothetical protein
MTRRWLLALLFTLSGCGGAAAHRAADEATGCAGDEQYRLLEDAEPGLQVDLVNAPQMIAPADGATVPADPKVIVQWNQSPTMPGTFDGDVPYIDGTPDCNACCPQLSFGGLTPFHLPVQTGDIYDLHLSIDGSYVWRVITTFQEWEPADAQWAEWKGHDVAIDFYRMTIAANVQTAGPYLSRSYRFHIGS